MEWKKANAIADKYLKLFKPGCIRIEKAGSIRRLKADVGDIELVLIPKFTIIKDGFFDEREERDAGFLKLVHSIPRVKGDGTGKYVQFLLPEEIKLDMFIARPTNWGYIFSIRTGSEHFSYNTLAKGWVRAGYKGVGGMLQDEFGNEIEIKEEKDLFDLIGIPFVKPEKRF